MFFKKAYLVCNLLLFPSYRFSLCLAVVELFLPLWLCCGSAVAELFSVSAVCGLLEKIF